MRLSITLNIFTLNYSHFFSFSKKNFFFFAYKWLIRRMEFTITSNSKNVPLVNELAEINELVDNDESTHNNKITKRWISVQGTHRSQPIQRIKGCVPGSVAGLRPSPRWNTKTYSEQPTMSSRSGAGGWRRGVNLQKTWQRLRKCLETEENKSCTSLTVVKSDWTWSMDNPHTPTPHPSKEGL